MTVTDVEHLHPDVCAVCGQALSPRQAKAYSGWHSVDIAELPHGTAGLCLKVTHHLLYETRCACGHVSRAGHYVAEPDELWKNVALGQ